MTKTPDLVCLGEPLIEFSQLSQGDGRNWLQGFGGDTSNAAIAAARQGASVGYATALGDDPFGAAFLALWQREAVDTSQVRRDGSAFTGVNFISYDQQGHHFHYIRRGSAASRLAADAALLDYVEAARLLHVSAISQAISPTARACVAAVIERARQAGRQVSYDTNLRLRLWPLEEARAVITETLGSCDIALPSRDDSALLCGSEDADAIVDFHLRLGPRIVALKMAAEGALIATAERRLRLAPHRVATIDATGAGDAFDGAFLARLLAGDDPFSAGRYANAAAALSTTGYGAVGAIPEVAAVRALLAQS